MATNMKQHKLGWIGIGRMGYAMAERLAKAGCDISVWNRTRAKAEPLAKSGAKVVDNLSDLAGCDIVFTMVSTGKDVKEVLFGASGVLSKGGKPKMVVDSTSISIEESAEIRAKLAEAKGADVLVELFIAQPQRQLDRADVAGLLERLGDGQDAEGHVVANGVPENVDRTHLAVDALIRLGQPGFDGAGDRDNLKG